MMQFVIQDKLEKPDSWHWMKKKLESAERLSFMTDEEVCSLLETEFIYIQRTS